LSIESEIRLLCRTVLHRSSFDIFKSCNDVASPHVCHFVRPTEWNNLIIKKESLHNKVKQWASNTKEDSILLDNGSTLSLFGNPKMVTNIRESKTTLELATNAGTRTTKKIADVPGYGTVLYDKAAIANIFGLSELKKKLRVTYDSEKEDAFIVHMNDNTLKFECNPKGLYTYKVSDEYIKKQSHLINTVQENRV
jgi:hypothetical protein